MAEINTLITAAEQIPTGASVSNELTFPKMPISREPSLCLPPKPKFDLIMDEEMGVEELKKKLQLVIQENTLMREKLQQDNIALKHQVITLNFWQDDVLKIHHKHLKRYEDAKEQIRKLVEEINCLKNEVNTIRNTNADLGLTVDRLQQENEDLNRYNMKVRAELEESCSEELKSDKQLQILLESEKDKVRFLEKKLREYERIAIRNRRRRLAPKDDELALTVEILSKRLDASERAKRALDVEFEKLIFYKSKLEYKLLDRETKNNRDIINFKMDKQLWKATDSFLGVEFPPLTIEPPESIATLKSKLAEEKGKLAHAKELLRLNQEQLSLLVATVTTYCKSREDHSSEGAESLINLQDTIDGLVIRLRAAQDELRIKNEQLNSLRMKMKDLELENESVGILKSQILVYRSEFNLERKSREDLVAERDRLLTDMRMLVQQNKKLNELASTNPRVQNETGADGGGASPRHATQLASQTEELVVPADGYPCPNPQCSKKFMEVHPLELHVEQCLKLTD